MLRKPDDFERPPFYQPVTGTVPAQSAPVPAREKTTEKWHKLHPAVRGSIVFAAGALASQVLTHTAPFLMSQDPDAEKSGRYQAVAECPAAMRPRLDIDVEESLRTAYSGASAQVLKFTCVNRDGATHSLKNLRDQNIIDVSGIPVIELRNRYDIVLDYQYVGEEPVVAVDPLSTDEGTPQSIGIIMPGERFEATGLHITEQ